MITKHKVSRGHPAQASDFYAQITHSLTASTDLRALIEHLSEEIASQLDVRYASFFVFIDSDRTISGGTEGRPNVPKADAQSIDLYMAGNRRIVSLGDLKKDDRLYRLMVSHQINIIVPLVRGHTHLGYIFIGDSLFGRHTKKQLALMSSIADEIAIAIQNTVSIHALRELNATLKQRINDATRELQSSNAQLQLLDKSKDEFISMASHQLRTPLTSVKGYLSMLLEGDAGEINETQRQLIDHAFNGSERMVHLISDFLNLSRLQTGTFLLDAHPVDIAKLVAQELDALKTDAMSRGLSLEYTPPTDAPMVTIDEDKVRQVIMNLADNALYYSKENSTIKVSLEFDKKFVTFRIKDSGMGVPKADQPGLFTKFFRASNAKKQRPDGTGIGLFVAKKVITAHGGTMLFESIEGKGSTFGFRLPLGGLPAAKDVN